MPIAFAKMYIYPVLQTVPYINRPPVLDIIANIQSYFTTCNLQASPVSLFPPPPPAAQHRKLFIGGLSHETTDEQLRDYYSNWGHVVDCIVIRDPVTRQSRGFGFVTYSTIEMADAAMADRPHTIAGKVVDPKRAIPREQMLQATICPPAFLDVEPPSDCKLCLSGITHHTVDILRHYFEQFGELEQVEIVGHTGHGFIVFEKRTSADRCMAHGKHHTINGRWVDVARAVPPPTTTTTPPPPK